VTDVAALAARHAPKPPAGVVIARLRGGDVEVASAGPVSTDAVFELGSITKVVTGLLLADAVVRGEVELDTTLDACLPGARPLPLADLASHSAGLPRVPLALLRRSGFTNSIDPYERTTVQELVDDLAGVRMRRPRLRYSNFGAALLGQALAARPGVRYARRVPARQRPRRPRALDRLHEPTSCDGRSRGARADAAVGQQDARGRSWVAALAGAPWCAYVVA
jgi:CubicO group peptidase (beta-lactamase class C family)